MWDLCHLSGVRREKNKKTKLAIFSHFFQTFLFIKLIVKKCMQNPVKISEWPRTDILFLNVQLEEEECGLTKLDFDIQTLPYRLKKIASHGNDLKLFMRHD